MITEDQIVMNVVKHMADEELIGLDRSIRATTPFSGINNANYALKGSWYTGTSPMTAADRMMILKKYRHFLPSYSIAMTLVSDYLAEIGMDLSQFIKGVGYVKKNIIDDKVLRNIFDEQMADAIARMFQFEADDKSKVIAQAMMQAQQSIGPKTLRATCFVISQLLPNKHEAEYLNFMTMAWIRMKMFGENPNKIFSKLKIVEDKNGHVSFIKDSRKTPRSPSVKTEESPADVKVKFPDYSIKFEDWVNGYSKPGSLSAFVSPKPHYHDIKDILTNEERFRNVWSPEMKNLNPSQADESQYSEGWPSETDVTPHSTSAVIPEYIGPEVERNDNPFASDIGEGRIEDLDEKLCEKIKDSASSMIWWYILRKHGEAEAYAYTAKLEKLWNKKQPMLEQENSSDSVLVINPGHLKGQWTNTEGNRKAFFQGRVVNLDAQIKKRMEELKEEEARPDRVLENHPDPRSSTMTYREMVLDSEIGILQAERQRLLDLIDNL